MQGEKNMKNGIWENEEVKSLFSTVEEEKSQNKSLRFAFAMHAHKYRRKPNSVRNYYYHEIDNLKNDAVRLKKIGVDLSKHEKYEIKYFSKEEEKLLMQKIDCDVKNGVSVRKACLDLSGGNVELMLRYQNKYRNFLSKEQPKEERDNIIKFTKKRSTISDAELQALFMGLVRLVKKSVYDEMNEKIILNKEKSSTELRKMIVQLQDKERELGQLKAEFLKIKQENAKLIENINSSRSEKAQKLKEKLESKQTIKKIYN